MSALAAVALVALGACVLYLIYLLDRPASEPQTWREAWDEDRRRELGRLDALRYVTFEPFAWRVVRGGRLVRTANPGDVSGRRVVGGEVVVRVAWRLAYDHEVVVMEPLLESERPRVH